MMISSIKDILLKNIRNISGWRTSRKIVVFESDDWGAIRMPSKEVYNKLLSRGLPVNKSFYNVNDSLESNNDMQALYEVLSKYKDGHGKHPQFTALAVVANPDFDKIRDNGFTKYEYEEVTKTLKRYGNSHDKVHDLWLEGIEKGLFWAECHGREHLHVERWMKCINAKDSFSEISFGYGFFGLGGGDTLRNGKSFMPAFDIDSIEDIVKQEIILKDAITVFEKTFGYKPVYFVAPNSTLSTKLEPRLANMGIQYIIGARNQKEPLGDGKVKHNFRYLGKKNDAGQMYMARNSQFEHGQWGDKQNYHKCLEDIEIAFRWKKPAVISTHRVNYMGYINEGNRKKGLEQLDRLLSGIVKKWPDVEFMNSRELANLISNHPTASND